MKKTLFYLVRHGETIDNKENKYGGWSDSDLTLQGKEDAIRAALLLGTLVPSKKTFIVSSDLKRASETANIISSILGIQEVEESPLLRPLNMGELAGKPQDDRLMEPYNKDKHLRIPGGESIEEFEVRQKAFFTALLDTVKNIDITPIVVCHVSNIEALNNLFSENKIFLEIKTTFSNTGSVFLFGADGIIPINQYEDGTTQSGFVTAKNNKPPRECWNCRWFRRDEFNLGSCAHPSVVHDPELKDRKQNNWTVAVGDRDCCNMFQNRII